MEFSFIFKCNLSNYEQFSNEVYQCNGPIGKKDLSYKKRKIVPAANFGEILRQILEASVQIR